MERIAFRGIGLDLSIPAGAASCLHVLTKPITVYNPHPSSTGEIYRRDAIHVDGTSLGAMAAASAMPLWAAPKLRHTKVVVMLAECGRLSYAHVILHNFLQPFFNGKPIDPPRCRCCQCPRRPVGGLIDDPRFEYARWGTHARWNTLSGIDTCHRFM